MLTLNNSFSINDYIIVNNKYIGKIIKRLWDGLGFIIKLENQLNYVDNTIAQYKLLDNNSNSNYAGYKMVTANDDVKSINPNNLYELINNELKKEQYIFIDEKLNKNYNSFKKDIFPSYKTIITNFNEYKNLTGGSNDINLLSYSKILSIKDIPQIHLPVNSQSSNQDTTSQVPTSQDTTSQDTTSQVPTSQVPTSQVPTSQVPNSQVPNSQVLTAQVSTSQDNIAQVGTAQESMNELSIAQLASYEEEDKNEDSYKLYIDNLISNLFTEEKKPYIDGFKDGKLTATEAEKKFIIAPGDKINIIKPAIKNYLELFDSINKSKLHDFKTSIMYKHIITDNLDIISLGKELIDKIKDKLIDIQKDLTYNNGEKTYNDINLFDFISFEINNGFIIIKDELVLQERLITKKLIPNLDELKDQYDKPIDYNYLKGLIFQNKTTLEIKKNKCLLAEALKILSQEYIIALQPKVEYLIWAVIRLILCWYSSDALNKNIYKIKILINLYRARGIKTFNKDNDVLPMIMILPNYGKEAALKVITHINYFFFPYRKLGLEENPPTYFNKVDNLLYYTNGSLNIKKYIKFLLSKKENLDMPFVDNYTKVKLTNKSNDIEYEE